MDTTRIPRIALVTVLCLLMVTWSGVGAVSAQSSDNIMIDDFEDCNLDGWDGSDQAHTHIVNGIEGDCAIGVDYNTSTGGTVTYDLAQGIDVSEPGTNLAYLIEDRGNSDAGGISYENKFYTRFGDSGGVLNIGLEGDQVDVQQNVPYRVVIYDMTTDGGPSGESTFTASVTNVDTGEVVYDSTAVMSSSESDTFINSIEFVVNTQENSNFAADNFIQNWYVPPEGGVSGEVTDQNNDPIENVTVTVENETGGVVETTETNPVGQYDFPLDDGEYNITASKDGYRSVTETVTVSGSYVTQNFQLDTFNQSINLNTKRFIEHGQAADYRVVVTNDTGRHNITGEATVNSGNESVVTVDTSALQLQATTDISVNQRTPVTAEWEDSEGNVYTTQTDVTVANATVDNIEILPTWTKTSASLGDETLQLIIVATMIGAGAALFASSFAGLSAATGITVLGWFAGMASDGVLIVSFMFAIFVGLNLAGNINMQVRQ